MAEHPQSKLLGRSPATYGIVSLIAACLAWLSWPLVIVIGVFLVIAVEIPLVSIAVVSGLLGLGAGVYHGNWLAVATSAVGLALIGGGVCFIVNALTHF